MHKKSVYDHRVDSYGQTKCSLRKEALLYSFHTEEPNKTKEEIMTEQDTVIMRKDKLKEVHGIIEEARAVQTLEYYNKNRLSKDVATNSRELIDLLTEALDHLNDVLKGGS